MEDVLVSAGVRPWLSSGCTVEFGVTIFGLWGMEQFVIGLIGAVILWRYKALIPVMALAYAIEYFGRFAAQWYTPGVTAENEPPGAVLDTVLVPLAFVMFGLSLWRRSLPVKATS